MQLSHLLALGVLLAVACSSTESPLSDAGAGDGSSVSCGNGSRDGTETDVDCGGSCGKCANGRTCNAPSDCLSGGCIGGFCVAAPSDGGIEASPSDGSTDGGEGPLALGGVDPANGPNYGGTLVTVNGSGFVPGTTIDVDGKSCGSVVVASSTSMTCVTPASANLGPVNVIVRKPDQTTVQGKLYAYFRGDLELGARIFAASAVAAIPIDVDGDGARDIVAAGGSANSVSVLLNLGHGVFGVPSTTAVGSTPTAIGSADFDGDGKADVAVAAKTGTAVHVLLNAGNGKLANPVSYGVGAAPWGLAVGDLDGNNGPDIVTANHGDGTVSILLNKGNGTFNVAVSKFIGGNPSQIVVADTSGDGKLDIILAAESNTSVGVMLNVGNGTFGSAVAYPAGGTVGSIAVGDVTGDAKPDVIATNGGVVRLTNTGSGFAAPVTVSTAAVRQVAVGDWNGDGSLDFVAVAPSLFAVDLFVNQGAGTFANPVEYASCHYFGEALGVGDLDGDNRPDVVSSSIQGVSVLRSSNGGLVGGKNGAADPGPWGIIAGDVNGDGRPDVAVSNSMGGSVSVFLNDGSGLGPGVSYPTGGAGRLAAFADFDGDGKPDIVHANYSNSTFGILKNLGGGTFGAPTVFAGGNGTWGVVALDANGDGKLDVVTSDFNFPYALRLFINNGNGTFAAPVQVGTGNAAQTQLVSADFDGDGRTDVLTGPYLLLNSSSGFQPPSTTGMLGFPVLLDFNGDGKTDVFTGGQSSLVFYQNTGGGTFKQALAAAGPAQAFGFAACDVNGDGYYDGIAAQPGFNGTGVQVAINRGTRFDEPALFAVGQNATLATCLDVDGDGKQDIAVSNNASLNMTLLHNASH